MALHQQGDTARAEEMYNEVLKKEPNEPNAWHLLGVAAWQRNDILIAEAHIRKAIKIHSPVAAYHSNLAGVLKQKGDAVGAIEEYEQALKLAPGDENVKRELAQLLHQQALKAAEQRQWDAARAGYIRVLELDPNNIATLNNLASITQHHESRSAARIIYDRALAIAPDNLLLRYNRSICLLTEGKMPEGWADFTASEPYWRDKQDNRANLPWLSVRLWNGRDDIRGKKILIWGDQGIGDEIVYTSAIPDLIELGADVTIECMDRLVPIFQRSFPTAHVLPRQTPPVPDNNFDFHAPGMWLARCLRPTMDSFPKRTSFLKADLEKTQKLRQRYSAFGKPVVGLSWYTQSYAWGKHRSVDLPDLLRALPLDDILIVDLQYGDTANAWQKAKEMFPNLNVFRDEEVNQFKDMDSYAAQVAACDSVVTICNTTSHMAGALGIPAAVLMADQGLTWYWFEEGEDCTWYPSLKLLRPSVPDRFAAVAQWLKNKA